MLRSTSELPSPSLQGAARLKDSALRAALVSSMPTTNKKKTREENDRHLLVNWITCKTELVFVLVNTRTPSDMDKGAVMPY